MKTKYAVDTEVTEIVISFTLFLPLFIFPPGLRRIKCQEEVVLS